MATQNTQQPKATIKQEREAKRLEKVAAFKAQQARAKRNRLIAIISSIVVGLLVVGGIVTAVVLSSQPKAPLPPLSGVETFAGLEGAGHVDPAPVDYEADYGMTPPAGGAHFSSWLNCGVYSEPVPSENAVHDLEHGAIWITYDAAQITGDDLATLQKAGPDTFMLISPYEGLPAPIVVSAWGFQLQADSVDDPRIEQFISEYWQAATAPEPGAPCTGGIDAPGRVG